MMSIGWWTVAAVLLFWSVGAYNRLVRLRAETNAAFAALDAQWLRQLALVDATRQALANGLWLLGIEAPHAM